MATDLFSTALNKAGRNNALVELYLDPTHPHHFCVALTQGTVVAGVVVIINISPDYKPEGIYVYRLSVIAKLKLNTRHLAPSPALPMS